MGNQPTEPSDSDDDDLMRERRKSLILEQSNSSVTKLSKLRDIYESQSELETSSEDDNVLKVKNNTNVRPKSTPFRSSKGTAIFLSHFKSHCADQCGGNLNELINGQQSIKQ